MDKTTKGMNRAMLVTPGILARFVCPAQRDFTPIHRGSGGYRYRPDFTQRKPTWFVPVSGSPLPRVPTM